MVWALAVTETISYGVLYYSFAAFLLLMQQSLGYGQATLTGAFSLSVLVTGAGAVPARAWLDRHGARGRRHCAAADQRPGRSRHLRSPARSRLRRPQPRLPDLLARYAPRHLRARLTMWCAIG
jgi:hypothetical protein